MNVSNRKWPELGAAVAVDTARVPSLQFAQVQTRRAEVVRWPAENVCAAAGSLHVLLAKVLLVYASQRIDAITPRPFDCLSCARSAEHLQHSDRPACKGRGRETAG